MRRLIIVSLLLGAVTACLKLGDAGDRFCEKHPDRCESAPGTGDDGGATGDGGSNEDGGSTDGGADAGACTDQANESCYSFDASTLGKGACHAGQRTCTGGTWSACVDEQGPTAEICDGTDNDCNDLTDDGLTCICTPNATASCYTGLAGTEGVGECHAGTKTCDATGTAFGACSGEVTEQADVCFDGKDSDCDGKTFCSREPTGIFRLANVTSGGLNAVSVVADSTGGGYVVAKFTGGTAQFSGISGSIAANSGEVAIIRFTSSGAVSWVRVWGGVNLQHPAGATVDAAENLYVIGLFGTSSGTPPPNVEFAVDGGAVPPLLANLVDGFVLKVSPAGIPLKLVSIGDATTPVANQQGAAIAFDPVTSRIFIAANVSGKPSVAGNAGAQTTSPQALIAALDTDLNLVGGTQIRQLSAPGATITATGVAVSGGEIALLGTTDAPANGTVTLVGGGVSDATAAGGSDVVLAFFDTDLQPLSLSVIGDANSQTASSLSGDPSGFNVSFQSAPGSVLVAKDSCSAVPSASGAVFARYGTNGTCSWRTIIDGAAEGRAVGPAPVVAGQINAGSITVGSDVLMRGGSLESFVATFDDAGIPERGAMIQGASVIDAIALTASGGWLISSPARPVSYSAPGDGGTLSLGAINSTGANYPVLFKLGQ